MFTLIIAVKPVFDPDLLILLNTTTHLIQNLVLFLRQRLGLREAPPLTLHWT